MFFVVLYLQMISFKNFYIAFAHVENIVLIVVLFCEMSTRKWLSKCLAKESVTRPHDLTRFHLSLSFHKNTFVTNAINVDVVIIYKNQGKGSTGDICSASKWLISDLGLV